MTQVSVNQGFQFPWHDRRYRALDAATGLIDAAGERIALIGRVIIDGRISPKTMGGTSSAISFRTGATTFAAAAGGTTIDIGIQGVSATAGPPSEPDDVFVAKKTLVSATDTLTTTAWNTVAIPSTSGTTSIAHGDLIAVVFDVVTRTASDSLIVAMLPHAILTSTGSEQPRAAWRTGGTWASLNLCPIVQLTFSDGTLGWLKACPPISTASVLDVSNASTDDEVGMLFKVPWDCQVGGAHLQAYVSAATGDFDVRLYSTPLGTPAVMGSYTFNLLAERGGAASVEGDWNLEFPSLITLTKNTDYCLAIKAIGAGNVGIAYGTVAAAANKAFYPNGLQWRKATRAWGAGTTDPGTAFTEEATPTTIYQMAVEISSFDDGAGVGGGGVVARVIGG